MTHIVHIVEQVLVSIAELLTVDAVLDFHFAVRTKGIDSIRHETIGLCHIVTAPANHGTIALDIVVGIINFNQAGIVLYAILVVILRAVIFANSLKEHRTVSVEPVPAGRFQSIGLVCKNIVLGILYCF